MILTREIISLNIDSNDWLICFETLLNEIEENIENQPDISIESCKSLLESISKNILKKMDATYNDRRINRTPVNTLLTEAKNLILEKTLENEEQFIIKLIAVTQQINDIRNDRWEISHGKKLPKEKTSTIQLAKTIKSFTDSLASYFLYLFLSIDFDFKEPITYEDNSEFNQILDNENPMPYYLSYSKALFDQDIISYQSQLDDYNLEQ